MATLHLHTVPAAASPLTPHTAAMEFENLQVQVEELASLLHVLSSADDIGRDLSGALRATSARADSIAQQAEQQTARFLGSQDTDWTRTEG
ncbi:hypothetical protein AAG614_03930 [Citromicrobium bathyomarinum]